MAMIGSLPSTLNDARTSYFNQKLKETPTAADLTSLSYVKIIVL
jgi:hypothetical protein